MVSISHTQYDLTNEIGSKPGVASGSIVAKVSYEGKRYLDLHKNYQYGKILRL